MEVKLRTIDLSIKESLRIGKQVSALVSSVLFSSGTWMTFLYLKEIDKCIEAMCELDCLTISPLLLKKNSDIVLTMRKVSF